MNCQETRNQLLLLSSGEAEANAEVRVRPHLKACAECRAFQTETEWILAATRHADHQPDVSELTVARIEAAAREGLDRPSGVAGRESSFWTTWRPALAYGAAAMLLLGMGIGYLRSQSADERMVADSVDLPASTTLAWNPALDVELDTMATVLTLAFDGVEETASESAEDIASDLMALEGWEI